MKDDIYLNKLGKKIVDLRTKKEISQNQLAKNIGSTNTHMRRIERGEVSCTINMLRKIAEVLEISISELVDIS
ncbi:MAG: helix-turn-helix transcriptional regulator [Bacteroidota bacterium]